MDSERIPNIWALMDPKCPDNEELAECLRKHVIQSLQKGESRFGWGTEDLRVLSQKDWSEMTESEGNSWSHSHRLLEIAPGDWIVHINIPERGYCTAARVCGEYKFDIDGGVDVDDGDDKWRDFGHCVPVDVSTKIEFQRDDARLHERVSRSLKPLRALQRVSYVAEFLEGLKALKTDAATQPDGESKGIRFLTEELKPQLVAVAELIYRNFPGKKLEYFLKNVFLAIPGVTNVAVNGSRWGTDYGADVIVTYESGLPIANLRAEQTLVVQVKSFTGTMYDQTAIEQIETAINKYEANAAMIFSTAEASDEFKKKLEEVNAKSKVPIVLIAGNDAARFVLKYGADILVDVGGG